MADTTASDQQHYAPGQHPNLPPPPGTVGPIHWVKENLFSSPLNAFLTLAALYLLYVCIPPIVEWAFLEATFAGSSKDDCTGSGACWVIIYVRWEQFIYGFYPSEETWRVNLAIILLGAALVPCLFDNVPYRGYGLIYAAIYPVIAFFLLYGGLGLDVVETPKWGGFMLTVVIGMTGIGASLPIGILLALGRRSTMPVVRSLCVGFIELIRGVPLITILFMSSVMLPLFLPEGVSFDKLVRALIGVALFSSAYMAEVVRGGLQAIPKGQYEAAQALGLSYWKMMWLIVLPQALRIVIPGIVSTFIGLFKDTTLVSIIGLLDPIGVSKASVADANWIGLGTETYVFVAAIFWVCCYSMARYSTWLEAKLYTGHKR